MSTEQHKAVLRRWIDAWKTRDASLLGALWADICTPDYIVHDPSLPGGMLVGVAAAQQWVRDVLTNTPDIRVELEDVMAEGDRVAMRLAVSGTDAATGKPISLMVLSIGRFVDGKIAEEWELAVPAASAEQDALAVVKALDAACNAGDLAAVMALFAADAALKDPVEPIIHRGQEQVRAWFAPQMGHIQVASTDHQVTGDAVTWRGVITGEAVRQLGSEALEEIAEATVRDGKITSFALTIVGRRP